MPLQVEGSEPIPVELAQRIAANCANLAAQTVFSSTTPVTALGLACEEFRSTLMIALDAAVVGSRVRQQCHSATLTFKSKPRKP
ncbi:hypothetical protein D7X30_07515 [Corallococcus sp. AB011P]|uniref:hypothetical protein n=1 Tax=Corallococcus sp. AB011P TaxID=2316735 RepID=UPI000EA172E5|nr:hypothetical protein [Corallococcus sp. AB011P]RKG60761.1 hypothetical protein D7X30_07515 [Corallococcus sp. AB011P]